MTTPPSRHIAGIAALATAFTTLAAAQSAHAATPKLAGTPTLTVAVRHHSARSMPAAWITFKTASKLENPRLVIARVRSHSGRTFRGAPGATCLRSTVVTDSSTIGVIPGHRYQVSFYSRQGIGRTRPKTLIATRTLVAHGLAADHRPEPPKCTSSSSRSHTSSSRSLIGTRAKVHADQLLFYKSPDDSYVGSLQHGQTFKVRKLSPSGKYAYGLAYGHLNRAGWVKTSGLRG